MQGADLGLLVPLLASAWARELIVAVCIAVQWPVPQLVHVVNPFCVIQEAGAASASFAAVSSVPGRASAHSRCSVDVCWVGEAVCLQGLRMKDQIPEKGKDKITQKPAHERALWFSSP